MSAKQRKRRNNLIKGVTRIALILLMIELMLFGFGAFSNIAIFLIIVFVCLFWIICFTVANGVNELNKLL